ncbi:MAG: PD-(D/E)XK nuclease family protein [Chloroflexi bacterium]|nr:PD-(D/E)XK nuclease family protein [Chloroflexota bacterium]
MVDDLSVKSESRPPARPKDSEMTPLQLSPSGISTFQQCRRRYKFQYIDKLGDKYGRPKPYFTMANHVHDTVRDFLRVRPVQLRTLTTIEQILQKNWARYHVGFRNAADEQRWRERALAQLRAFVAQHDITVHPIMMEEFLRAEVAPGLVLCGRLDRVDKEHDGSLHIIDYKTGNMPDEMDWMQLELHALILSRRFSLPINKVSYLYLNTSSLQTSLMSSERLAQAQWDFLVAAKAITREKKFTPTPTIWCRNCDFLPICPKKAEIPHSSSIDGQLELWDELNESDNF